MIFLFIYSFDDFYEPPDMYPRLGPPVGPGPMSRDRGGFRSSPYGDAPYPNRRGRFLPDDEDFGPPLRRDARRREDKLFMRGCLVLY